jgi:hypothetical protein
MLESIIIVTNNPEALDKLKLKYKVDFIQGDVMDVLKKVRDYIHINHRLLTHPLVSSIKPNEIPYRTVIISQKRDTIMDMDSLELIESSISTTVKFLNDFGIPKWSDNILKDFQVIDFDIINNVLK